MTAMHTGSEGNKHTQTFEYDHFGNVLKTTDELGFVEEYTYDLNGNVLTYVDKNGTVVYNTYNGFNRLTGVYSDNLEAKYTYDHTGLRTSKTVNGTFTRLVNDGQNVVAQYVDGRASHFYRGSSLIGYTNSQSEVNFYQFNAHGDVVSILDCFGNTVRNYDYDAFGKQKDDIDSFYRNQYGIEIDDNPFRYCGEYFDDETGLIYLRARYYNPDVQRFVAQDVHWNPSNMIYGDNPIELTLNFDESVELINRNTLLPVFSIIVQSNNGFVYSGNNPLFFQDENGEFFNTIVGAIGGAINGAIKAVKNGDSILGGVVAGAVSGAISGVAVDVALVIPGGAIAGTALAAAGGAFSSGIDYALTEWFNGRKVELDVLGVQAVSGATAAATSFGFSTLVNGPLDVFEEKSLWKNYVTKGKEQFKNGVLHTPNATSKEISSAIINNSAKGAAASFGETFIGNGVVDYATYEYEKNK